jgi:antitoxin component of MazEF toxin-antitoxin module
MDNIRKITKNGRNSYYVNIPYDIMKELHWRERQKVVVKKSGNKVIISDWPARH